MEPPARDPTTPPTSSPMSYLSMWLFVWSVIYFVRGGALPSPFLANTVALTAVVFLHATTDDDPQRFLYGVLTHLFTLILTLPPRLTAQDAVANAVVFATYALCVYILGDNVYAIYARYRDHLAQA